jgi:hypothetical protein
VRYLDLVSGRRLDELRRTSPGWVLIRISGRPQNPSVIDEHIDAPGLLVGLAHYAIHIDRVCHVRNQKMSAANIGGGMEGVRVDVDEERLGSTRCEVAGELQSNPAARAGDDHRTPNASSPAQATPRGIR